MQAQVLEVEVRRLLLEAQEKGTEKTNVYYDMQNKTQEIMVSTALELKRGNQSEAAKFLGINRATLRSKMK